MDQYLCQLDTLRGLLAQSKKVVMFTGAGISTESGIPDFRSPGGIWTKYSPIEFSDFMGSEEMRRESWRRKFAMDKVLKTAEPNRGHRAIAKLVSDKKAISVITQNIDGLHQASGVPDEKLVELHGNATYAKCVTCGERKELEDIRIIFEIEDRLPKCDSCNGVYVKTATISFGQTMPENEMIRAQEVTLRSDLFIVLGSSLSVYPAAGFPLMAKKNGSTMVIINRDETNLDHYADLVVNREIGTIFGDAVRVN